MNIELCSCEICTPYHPQGICAPMQPIGWCIRCGKPETQEQLDKLEGELNNENKTTAFNTDVTILADVTRGLRLPSSNRHKD